MKKIVLFVLTFILFFTFTLNHANAAGLDPSAGDMTAHARILSGYLVRNDSGQLSNFSALYSHPEAITSAVNFNSNARFFVVSACLKTSGQLASFAWLGADGTPLSNTYIPTDVRAILKSTYGWTDDEISYAVDHYYFGFITKTMPYASNENYSVEIECDIDFLTPYSGDVAIQKDMYAMALNAIKSYLLSDALWENGNPKRDNDHLPMLTYSLQRNTVIGFPNVGQIKETLKWDYNEKEPYRSAPQNYHLEIVASANFKPAPTGIGNIRDGDNLSMNDLCKIFITQNASVQNNSYSFLYSDQGKILYKNVGENWDDNSGYTVYIRTVENQGSKCSYWKVYNFAMNGYVVQEDILMDENGNVKPLPDEDRDIGGADNGDGSGTSTAPYSPDYSTDAANDPTSAGYDSSGKVNVNTFIANLKSIVNSLLELPRIMSQLMTVLPDYFITLIVTAMGLLIIIGLVKVIVG